MKPNYKIPVIIIVFMLVTAVAIFFTILPAEAVPDNQTADLDQIFEKHGAVILFSEPDSGNILYANSAAAEFYEYTKEQLTTMAFSQINTPAPGQITRMNAYKEKGYPLFQHRQANGELHWLEVYSSPAEYRGQAVSLMIVHDITPKIILQRKHQRLVVFTSIAVVCVLGTLLYLLMKLHRKTKSLAQANKELANYIELRKTFINADNNFVYLKDEHLKYMFANKALKEYFQLTDNQLVGHDDLSLLEKGFAEMCINADLDVLKRRHPITSTTSWKNRFFRTTKFPVPMLNGAFGVGAYISDVTEEYERSRERERRLKHNKLLLEMLSRGFQNMQEQLDYALHQLLRISGSQYGYIYFYSEEKEEFNLNSWTQGVMKECTVPGRPRVYQLDSTGIWGEVVRQRRPIIVNDFEKDNPLKKGYPGGHVQLKKFMSVPVFIDGKIVAVVGFGNKQTDYDETDVEEMTTLMSGVWNTVQRRESSKMLVYERNKYYQTLLSIGDGVMVIDLNKNIEFFNAVASRLTGWTLEEALGVNYKEIFVLSHEQEGLTIEDPIEKAFSTGEIQMLGNHAVLTSKNGAQYYLEDSAAPILDDQGSFAGVVLVFRDITEKKEQRKRIEYISYHDSLTGLYNRRFFEEELRRLDTGRNFPISILMADVDSLKLTNDIFGHAFGDTLLERVSGILRDACRADDIIARWGGDEFVLLLPKTSRKEAENIAQRIKNRVREQQIRAIKCSISIGYDTKSTMSKDIIQTLDNAEAKMYADKTLGRGDVQGSELEAIVNSLYANSGHERRHATHVSEICRKLGTALGLPEADIQRLTEAARLHDIGKIVLDPNILKKDSLLSPAEKKELAKHPIVGFRILNYFDETLELAEIVLAHHENWDGSGYPRGLKGENIPLLARIISLAEAYDRMLHVSDQAQAKSRDQAMQEIQRCAGTQFDPQIVNVFVKMSNPILRQP